MTERRPTRGVVGQDRYLLRQELRVRRGHSRPHSPPRRFSVRADRIHCVWLTRPSHTNSAQQRERAGVSETDSRSLMSASAQLSA